MEEFVNNSRMNANAVWATGAEIVAAASLLNTPIVIHTEDQAGVRRWLSYEPLRVAPPYTYHRCQVYLTNYQEHFNRVLSV